MLEQSLVYLLFLCVLGFGVFGLGVEFRGFGLGRQAIGSLKTTILLREPPKVLEGFLAFGGVQRVKRPQPHRGLVFFWFLMVEASSIQWLRPGVLEEKGVDLGVCVCRFSWVFWGVILTNLPLQVL